MFRESSGVRPRTIHGRSFASPSRPCSAPGRATARTPTGEGRASRMTSGPASRSRPWSSATAARTPRPASSSRATPRRASRGSTATCCSRRRARTSSPGTHETQPIAVLDERLPAAAAELRDDAARLEAHYRDLCDIEFTIEQKRLWLLQVRVGKRSPRAALRIALDMANDPAFPLSRAEAVARVAPLLAEPPRRRTGRGIDLEPLVSGLAASPGLGLRRDRDEPGGGAASCR